MLKLILLRKKQSDAKKRLEAARASLEDIKKREAELAQAIDEAETDEEKSAVEAAVDEIDTANSEAQDAIAAVEAELQQIEADLVAAEEEAAAAVGGDPAPDDSEDPEVERAFRSFQRRSNVRMDIREAQNFQKTGRHTYKNVRSILAPATSAATTIGPTGVGGINNPIAGVSALCDLVKITDCTSMAAYKVAFLASDVAAAARTDGAAVAATDPTFGSVTLTPAIVGTLGYVSKEIRKQSPLNYEEKVQESARRALRRAVNDKIVDAVLKSSQATSYDLVAEASATTGEGMFDAKLLSNIILSYGGDEGIDGAAVLVLNKKDLQAFAAVRGTNEYLPVYSIVPDAANPSTGVIKDNNGLSCRYILSKDLAALSDKTLGTTASKHMIYGNPQCIELAVWGGYDVEVSSEYKFAEGLLTVIGEAQVASDVTVKDGVVIVTAKKKAS